MKNIKFSTAFLTTLVILIWGTVAYQVLASLSEEEVTENPSRPHKQTANATPYVYKSDVRDPFRFAPPPRRDTTGIKRPSKPVWSPPPLKLTGILTGGKKKTAMLESSTGLVFFLQEGDTVQGARVLKITGTNVLYVYQKKKDEWSLERKQH